MPHSASMSYRAVCIIFFKRSNSISNQNTRAYIEQYLRLYTMLYLKEYRLFYNENTLLKAMCF